MSKCSYMSWERLRRETQDKKMVHVEFRENTSMRFQVSAKTKRDDIHSSPNTYILIPELKYYFLLLSSLHI